MIDQETLPTAAEIAPVAAPVQPLVPNPPLAPSAVPLAKGKKGTPAPSATEEDFGETSTYTRPTDTTIRGWERAYEWAIIFPGTGKPKARCRFCIECGRNTQFTKPVSCAAAAAYMVSTCFSCMISTCSHACIIVGVMQQMVEGETGACMFYACFLLPIPDSSAEYCQHASMHLSATSACMSGRRSPASFASMSASIWLNTCQSLRARFLYSLRV